MKNKKLNKHFKKAFTLVELIIVIAVIAILAVFLVPNFSNVLGDASATNVKSDTANIKNIVMAYISEVGAVPVANTHATANNVISITSGGVTSVPGISTAMFQQTAQDGEYYVIDMDLLTKKQINIEDKVTVTSAKLSAIPSTSAIVDVASTSASDTNKTTTDVVTNKKVKNTSVVFVIDKDLNVYPAYSKTIKSKKTAVSDFSAPTTNWVILSDSIPESNDTTVKQNDTFKVAATTINPNQIFTSMKADDSNYN